MNEFYSMLTEKQKSIIIEAMKPLKPTKIGVFGSYARNEENEHSDIDLLYSFNSDYGLIEILDLKELIEKKLNRHVDLVPFRTKSILDEFIQNDIKVFFNEKTFEK